MTWVLNDNLPNPIEDGDSFVSANGTHYPGNWDKSSVPGMARVVETARPIDTASTTTTKSVELVNGVPTRKWVTTTHPLATCKANKIASLNTLAADKIALGWTYNAKTYQCHGVHLDNLKTFINACAYYRGEIAGWLTLTAYVIGDRVQVSGEFYRCIVAHTSSVWLTELSAAKWELWNFNPRKGGDGKWRDKDNSRNALTLAQRKTMAEGAIDYAHTCLDQATIHKDAINALGTAAAVTAYDITAGWPANS